MSKKKFIFCVYGFLRDMHPNLFNFGGCDKFIYVPAQRYEDKSILVTKSEIFKRYGNDSVVNLYEYDSSIFNEEAKKLNVPPLNRHYQQPQRILSFFMHIKKSVEMINSVSGSYDDNTIVYLLRSDLGVKYVDFKKTEELLKTSDVIVEKFTSAGFRDLYFATKLKNIKVFESLYDSYKKYIVNFYNKNIPHPTDIAPEPIFSFHFSQNNLKVDESPVVNYKWGHVCNEFCGHNKENTKILGQK